MQSTLSQNEYNKKSKYSRSVRDTSLKNLKHSDFASFGPQQQKNYSSHKGYNKKQYNLFNKNNGRLENSIENQEVKRLRRRVISFGDLQKSKTKKELIAEAYSTDNSALFNSFCKQAQLEIRRMRGYSSREKNRNDETNHFNSTKLPKIGNELTNSNLIKSSLNISKPNMLIESKIQINGDFWNDQIKQEINDETNKTVKRTQLKLGKRTRPKIINQKQIIANCAKNIN